MIYPKTFFSQFDPTTREPDLVFVLMPFADIFQEIYDEVIKPTVEALGLRCLRADEVFSSGPVMESILESIAKSRFIIADVTGRTPNVFYELGIAHSMMDDVIIITQTMDDVPFDLHHLRCIVYSQTLRGGRRLRTHLIRTIETILAKEFDPNELVQRASRLMKRFQTLLQKLDLLLQSGLDATTHDQALLAREEIKMFAIQLRDQIETVEYCKMALEDRPDSRANRRRLDEATQRLQQAIGRSGRLLFDYERDWA